MSYQRISELASMYSRITGEEKHVARSIILQTTAGRAIAQSNGAFLYEQPESNLFDIAAELPDGLRSQFTIDTISAAAASRLQRAPVDRMVCAANPDLKISYRHSLKASAKAKLKFAARKSNSIRRIAYVNQIKGSEQ